MRYHTLRHIASIVLLASYLPMVMLSSFHVHHETIDSCDDCGQCAGHLEDQHHHQSDCQYCYFLNLNYWGQEAVSAENTFPVVRDLLSVVYAPMPIHCYGTAFLRAPPIVIA